MKHYTGRNALASLLLLLAPVATWGAAPNPVITSAWPAGGQAGTSVDITVTGSHLGSLNQLTTTAPGLRTEFLGSDKNPQFRITIPAKTPPGIYDLRLENNHTTSSPWTFQVSSRREFQEKEPNSKLTESQPAHLNSICNGRILEAGDQDCYRFRASRGQRIVLECFAERLGSSLHPIMQLFDGSGQLLKVSRGYFGIDPLIDFRVPTDGDYIVRLHDLTYTGGSNHTYRLDIDTGPRVAIAFPPVIQRGQTAALRLFGWNLANKTKSPHPALDHVDVKVAPTEAQPQWPLPIPLAPAQAPVDAMAYHLAGAHAPVLVSLTDIPVTLDGPTNHTAPEAIGLEIPAEAAGRLVEADEQDWYSFRVRKGEVVYVEVFGERIGSPVHLAASVLDKTGRKELLRCRRDPTNIGGLSLPSRHADPSGRFRAPADGTYTVVVYHRSGGIHPDPRRVYRLSLRREVPVADLAVVHPNTSPSSLNIAPGGRLTLDVVAFRRRGASGSITLFAEDLPAGITIPPISLGPGVSRGQLVISANPGAASLRGNVSLWSQLDESPDEKHRPVKSGIVVRGGRPTGWSRLAHELRLGISGSSPLRITADGHETRKHHLYGELKVRHAPGGVLDVAIEVERKAPDHRAEVQLIGVGLPPGISNQTATIPASNDKGYISFYLPPGLSPGRYTLGVQATTTVPTADGKKTETASVISNPVVFEVHEPMFHVTLDPYNPRTIRRGEIVQVKYRVRRLNGFINKVHSELAAPGTVTKVGGLRGRGVTFVGQTESGAIQVVASDDAPLGQRAFLRVYAVGVLEDEALYHGSHFLNLRIVE